MPLAIKGVLFEPRKVCVIPPQVAPVDLRHVATGSLGSVVLRLLATPRRQRGWEVSSGGPSNAQLNFKDRVALEKIRVVIGVHDGETLGPQNHRRVE